MKTLAKVIGLLASSSALVACGGNDKVADASGTTIEPLAGCDGFELSPPPAGAGKQFSIEIDLAAGEENELCQYVMAGEALNVNWSDGLFTPGSHHALLHRTGSFDAFPTTNNSGQPIDPSKPFPCNAGADVPATGVIGTGQAVDAPPGTGGNNRGIFPDDVAFKIAANEVLLLDFHMFNATDHDVRACYKVNLNTIPDDQVAHEAGTIFWYHPFITLPANGSSTSEMACPVTENVSLATAVSHTHKRGVAYTSALLDGDPLAGGQTVRALHETTEWHDPKPDVYSPPIALTQGQWIDWKCSFENDEARNVAQGFETTDEMCMFVGSYWPRSAAMDFCGQGGLPFLGRPLFNGTKNGADYLACMGTHGPFDFFGGGPETSESRYTLQKCVTDLCPEVSGHVFETITGGFDMSTATCN